LDEQPWRRPFGISGKPRRSAGAGDRGERSGVFSKAVGYSPRGALGDRLQFPNIFIPESKRTFVHLAQAIQEYRNIDVMFFILVFEWLEAAMEKSVFYAVDQIRNYTFQPKGESFFAFLREFEIKSNNLSYFIDFTFSEIFINKTVSDAVNRLRVDANNFLTNKPIAHIIPHHRSGYTLGKDFFVSQAKYKGRR
jgi:hypothetical protein